MTLLSVKDLESGYGTIQVLRDIGFTVEAGEFLGILGHNGMGKSTLLKTIAGALAATRGSILFQGREITKEPSHIRARGGIGFVPQGRQIFPTLTVRENMSMAALGTGQPPEIVERVLARFPRLHPIVDRVGGVLSGGEQQILALARCLCGAPKILLLDEPTEGVQPSIRDEIVDTLRGLRAESELTLLLVEQNVKFMENLADRMLHMDKGRLRSAAHAAAW